MILNHLNISLQEPAPASGVSGMTATRLILYYDKKTRYSVNALIAAADRVPGVRVEVADTPGRLMEEVEEASRNREKCVVGYSLLTTMLVDESFLNTLKTILHHAESHGCLTIAGGPHASGDPVGVLRSLGFKVVFIGEAEETIREFLGELVNDGDPLRVQGLAFYEDDRLVFTGRRKPVDLDNYDPFPYWRGLINPVEVTRGCPYGCSYCQVSYMHGAFYRHRSIGRIVYYVRELARLGVRDYRFITPDSLSYGLSTVRREPDVGLIDELLSSLHEVARDVGGRIFYGSFPSEVRPEHVTGEAVRVLRRYVSNREIIVGAQSGSDRVLSMVRRGHSVDDVLNAVRVISENGFTPSVDVILGIPGETREDQEETLRLIERILGMGGRIHVHYYLPLPGTPLGLKTPAPVPADVEARISRLIGSGKAYGSWFNQKELSRRILELHRRGLIAPSQRANA